MSLQPRALDVRALFLPCFLPPLTTRRYLEELWNEGDLSVADELLSDDFVSHWMPQGEGPEFMKEVLPTGTTDNSARMSRLTR